MPALTIEQIRRQLRNAEDRMHAVQAGERPEWDRALTETALKMARTKLNNIDGRCTNA